MISNVDIFLHSDDVCGQLSGPVFEKFFRVTARHHRITVLVLAQEYGKFLATPMSQSSYIFLQMRGFASFSQIIMK